MEYSLNQKEKKLIPPPINTTHTTNQTCNCFFCTLKHHPKSSLSRTTSLTAFLNQMPSSIDNHENVLILSELWTTAMHHPDDPQLPSLGIFASMAGLIQKAINSPTWLLHDQNIYIPYYAAHIIGSYTMNKPEFAEQAAESGVIPPLIDLLRGKISWVEQRVAVRALGHLASYQTTFEAVAVHEREVIELAMELACSAADVVYKEFVGVKDGGALRLKYHCDLLTRGVGGLEMEDRKAEEWASQLQCWSLYLLNCFASKERSITLICSRVGFLERLAKMWGGLANHSSPAGVGLLRILCYYKSGRKKIAESKQVIQTLCNISRSSDDWQYMGIDCLVLLLKDQETRYRVMEIACLCLVDLVEVRNLGNYRSNVGETVTEALLLDYSNKLQWNWKGNAKVQKGLEEVWSLKVGRRKRERAMSAEKLEERKVLAMLIKQQAKRFFLVGETEEALAKYGEALETCPLRYRRERMGLYGDRAECRLAVGDVDGVISDSTRAISLSSSSPATSDGRNKSLWRRAKGYEMKGMAKECLMDCIMYVSGCVKVQRRRSSGGGGGVIPYDAVRLMSKMMDATWLFADAAKRAKAADDEALLVKDLDNGGDGDNHGVGELEEIVMRMVMAEKGVDDISLSGLSTIVEEEPLGCMGKEYLSRRKLGRPRTGKKKPPSL